MISAQINSCAEIAQIVSHARLIRLAAGCSRASFAQIGPGVRPARQPERRNSNAFSLTSASP
jgi:hypothetical protein